MTVLFDVVLEAGVVAIRVVVCLVSRISCLIVSFGIVSAFVCGRLIVIGRPIRVIKISETTGCKREYPGTGTQQCAASGGLWGHTKS